MRSIAEQVNTSQVKIVNSDLSPNANSMEAYVQRQQALNNALQQAAAGKFILQFIILDTIFLNTVVTFVHFIIGRNMSF